MLNLRLFHSAVLCPYIADCVDTSLCGLTNLAHISSGKFSGNPLARAMAHIWAHVIMDSGYAEAPFLPEHAWHRSL